METHEVIIIGAGPCGLGAARRLASLGVRDVVVLEREQEAGGIPRHCGHTGFGWNSHYRLWTGPRFASELRQSVQGLDVRTDTSVLKLEPNGRMHVRDQHGVAVMQARRVLIATGTRETPRSARLVGGTRPSGVMNTGALQQHVYLHGFAPFKRPVIVGSEWVAFSALLTCRHLGIAPVAMLEENTLLSAASGHSLVDSVLGWGLRSVGRAVFGTQVLTQTRLIAIRGQAQVNAVEVEHGGVHRHIDCDGVVFCGQFRPENALFDEALGDAPLRCEHRAPRMDTPFRCSDPAYFAAGNVLAPLKNAGNCWRQGASAAQHMLASLQ